MLKMNKHFENWVQRETNKGYNRADVVASAEYFVKNKVLFQDKDIFSWDAKALEDKIKAGVVSKRVRNRGDYVTIKEDARFIVVRLNDKQAAIFWGKDTKWCISMEEGDYFDSYRSESNVVFYVIVDKLAGKRARANRYCIVFHRYTDNTIKNCKIYNSKDNIVKNLPKDMKNFIG